MQLQNVSRCPVPAHHLTSCAAACWKGVPLRLWGRAHWHPVLLPPTCRQTIFIPAAALLQENNFKAVLECIRDLMNEQTVVPDWLHDVFLGYGDPAQAQYGNMPQDQLLQTVDFKVRPQARSRPGPMLPVEWQTLFVGSGALKSSMQVPDCRCLRICRLGGPPAQIRPQCQTECKAANVYAASDGWMPAELSQDSSVCCQSG